MCRSSLAPAPNQPKSEATLAAAESAQTKAKLAHGVSAAPSDLLPPPRRRRRLRRRDTLIIHIPPLFPDPEPERQEEPSRTIIILLPPTFTACPASATACRANHPQPSITHQEPPPPHANHTLPLQPHILHPSSPRHFTTMSHTYEFNVSMSCGGCSGAVDRVLKKLEGMPLLQPPRPTSPFVLWCGGRARARANSGSPRRRELRSLPREPVSQGRHRPPLRCRAPEDCQDGKEGQLGQG